jgi:hypothetical protein
MNKFLLFLYNLKSISISSYDSLKGCTAGTVSGYTQYLDGYCFDAGSQGSYKFSFPKVSFYRSSGCPSHPTPQVEKLPTVCEETPMDDDGGGYRVVRPPSSAASSSSVSTRAFSVSLADPAGASLSKDKDPAGQDDYDYGYGPAGTTELYDVWTSVTSRTEHSASPSIAPTEVPAAVPTTVPTAVPTVGLTAAPLFDPTIAPTEVSSAPVPSSSRTPTQPPSLSPSSVPDVTTAPSTPSTVVPTSVGTGTVTRRPTTAPSAFVDQTVVVTVDQVCKLYIAVAANRHVECSTKITVFSFFSSFFFRLFREFPLPNS